MDYNGHASVGSVMTRSMATEIHGMKSKWDILVHLLLFRFFEKDLGKQKKIRNLSKIK